MKTPLIFLYQLAKIFVKYDYFSDEKSPTETYGVLMEVYETLSTKGKEELLEWYKILKPQRIPTAESNGEGGQNGK